MSYYGFVVTDSGRELIAKLVAGQQLSISKIMVGSGTIPDDVKPTALTALVEPVAAGTSTAPIYDGANIRMIVEYRSDLNGGLDHGFWLREFGIFAFDPDKGEVLIYYGTLGDYPQYVSAASNTGVDVRRFPVCIVIGEGLDVTVDYKCEAWMTAEDVEQYCSVTMLPVFLKEAQKFVNKHDEDNEAHHSIQNSVSEVKARLALLELLFNTSVGNPFTVTFETLDGVVVDGIWNTEFKRIDF